MIRYKVSSLMALFLISGCAFKENAMPPVEIPSEESPQVTSPAAAIEGSLSLAWKTVTGDDVRASRSLMTTTRARTWKTDAPTTLPQVPPDQVVLTVKMNANAVPNQWIASIRADGMESRPLQVALLDSVELGATEIRISDLVNGSPVRLTESFTLTLVGEREGEPFTLEIDLRLPPMLLEIVQGPLKDEDWKQVPDEDRKRFFKSAKFPLVLTHVIRLRNVGTESLTVALPTDLRQLEVISLVGHYFDPEANGRCVTTPNVKPTSQSMAYLTTLVPLDQNYGRRIAVLLNVVEFPKKEIVTLAANETLIVGIAAAAGTPFREQIRLKDYVPRVPIERQLPDRCETQCAKSNLGSFLEYWQSLHGMTPDQADYVASCRFCSEGYELYCQRCRQTETVEAHWKANTFRSLFCAEIVSQTHTQLQFKFNWIDAQINRTFIAGSRDQGHYFKQNPNHQGRNFIQVYFTADYDQALPSYREIPAIQLGMPFNPNE